MNLLKELDQDIDDRFRKVVSNGWKLRNVMTYESRKIRLIEEEQNRLQGYYSSIKLIKIICFSHITPSGKIYIKHISDNLRSIELEAVENENYELAQIANIYQNKIDQM